eukprot:751700-Prorocentrum_minimum.AAC.2
MADLHGGGDQDDHDEEAVVQDALKHVDPHHLPRVDLVENLAEDCERANGRSDGPNPQPCLSARHGPRWRPTKRRAALVRRLVQRFVQDNTTSAKRPSGLSSRARRTAPLASRSVTFGNIWIGIVTYSGSVRNPPQAILE